MIKNHLQRTLMIFVTLACMGTTWANEASVTFDFSSPQTLAAMGLDTPTSSVRTNITSPINIDGVTLTPSASPVPQVTYYKNAYNLYLFSNTSITLNVPDGSEITNVTFTGLYETLNVKASEGNVDGLVWTGNAQSVKFSATGSNTIYTVSVTYTERTPIENATGLGALRQIPDDTRVRLYLPDSNNCRVTYASEDGAEVYLRDNTGAVMLENIDANRTFAPNQHIAGWITGIFSLKNGMPKLMADGSLTNTTQLVIADPVTEEAVNATTITPPTYARHAANLIRLMNLTIKNGKAVYGSHEFVINNLYSIGKDEKYQTPYEGATIDLVCLAVPTANDNTIVPVYVNYVNPIYYVVAENTPFVAPSVNITNTAVRLTRDLIAGQWNSIVLPFDLDRFNGTLMQPSTLASGKLTMKQASRLIEHHKPYLFKPIANDANTNTTYFKDVTLYAGSPTTAQGMSGMYNNTTFMDAKVTALGYENGNPMLVNVPASQIKTTHAYFTGVSSLDINGELVAMYADVNCDGTVDVDDVNEIINVILGTHINTGKLSDVNNDGTVDVDDVNVVINTILGSTEMPDVVLHSRGNNIINIK